MKYFINKDKKTYSYIFENQIFCLYKNGNMIFSTNSILKKPTFPVSPMFIEEHLILFDYDRGIEIISKEKNFFKDTCCL